MSTPDPNQLLDPDAISRAESLGFNARFIVEGYMAGEHQSPYRGFAIEFAQHREYTHGDDPRHLDWKVLGRTDRYSIKQYEQETNYVAHILLHDMARQLRRKGIVILISDFFDDEEKVLDGIQHLRFGGNEVVVFHVFDPYELEFPFTGLVEFDGLEQIPKILTRPSEIRKS